MYLKPINLVRIAQLKRIICFIVMISLLISLYPSSFKYVSAKESFKRIGIKQKTVVVQIGDKFELDCYGSNDWIVLGSLIQSEEDISNVSWKSSNTKVATVSKSGYLSAKQSGKCIITATWGKLKAQCKIRVYTERELYDHVLDADMAHEDVYLALTTDYYDNYGLIYATESIKEIADKKVAAAKKAKEIISTIITKDMTDYDKMMTVAAWIIENIEVIKNYKSKFSKEWLNTYDKNYYYLDPLLYGKSNYKGVGLLFELLLNICGIRCELMYQGGNYNTDYGEETYVSDCNVVELDGDYYYFDIISLVYGMQSLREVSNTKHSFYELLVTESTTVDRFIHVTTSNDKAEHKQYKTNPRDTFYDSYRDHRVYIDDNPVGPSTYSHYFYDFYNNKLRFVTPKEDKAYPDMSVTPYFSLLPIYPDSNSTKYKKILEQEAAIISKIIELSDTADNIIQDINDGFPVSQEYITSLTDSIADIESEFETIKDTITINDLITYLEGKITETKDKVTNVQTKYYNGGITNEDY